MFECKNNFQQTIIYNSLQLSNNLVRYYKTQLVENFSSASISDEKLLSQIAWNNIFEELSDFNNKDKITFALNNDDSYNKIDIADARFLNYLNINSKKELQDSYRSYIAQANSKMTMTNTLKSIPRSDKAPVLPSQPILKPSSKSPINSQSDAHFIHVRDSNQTIKTISKPDLSNLARSSGTKYIFTIGWGFWTQQQ